VRHRHGAHADPECVERHTGGHFFCRTRVRVGIHFTSLDAESIERVEIAPSANDAEQ